MRIEDFDLKALPSAQKSRHWLDIAPRVFDSGCRLPLLCVTGADEGPTLLVLAGVHGDEYEGMAAIHQLFARVDPGQLRGRLLMLPVCNPPAYEAARRLSSVDRLNLARVFPGDRDGLITQRIACWITEALLRHSDFLIDLHTGGIAYELPTLIGYPHDDGELGLACRAAAEAFGAPVLWGHPLPLPAGRTISAATDLGIPSLYTEAPGGGGCDPDVAACFREGVLNVMKHLGMLTGDLNQRRATHRLVGDGNLDTVISVQQAGFFQPEVALLEEVAAGQRLGRVCDPMGVTIEEVTADGDGVVIMLRGLPRVSAGDGVAHLTQHDQPGD